MCDLSFPGATRHEYLKKSNRPIGKMSAELPNLVKVVTAVRYYWGHKSNGK